MPQRTETLLRCLACDADFIGPRAVSQATQHHDTEHHRVVGTVTTFLDMDASDNPKEPSHANR